jgi:hypothetical protein
VKKTALPYPLAVLVLGIMAFFAVKYVNDLNSRLPTAATIPEEEAQAKPKLFILTGQSNMVGIVELPEEEFRSNPKILVFDYDGQWKTAIEAKDGSEADRAPGNFNPRYGPSLAFANALAERYPEMVIGLVPCAVGDTTISQWRKSAAEDSLYGSCLKRVRAASVIGEPAGLLFYQGEADAMDPVRYPNAERLPHAWASEFERYVLDWRGDLGMEELPVAFAQLGSNRAPDKFIHWDAVKEQQASVHLPFTAMIKTDDLELADTVHFTSESYQAIGRRFADAYVELTTK